MLLLESVVFGEDLGLQGEDLFLRAEEDFLFPEEQHFLVPEEKGVLLKVVCPREGIFDGRPISHGKML